VSEKLEMKYGLILHVIHVSGRRIIAQGTDGLSLAEIWEGVMKGLYMCVFIPLHLFPTTREPKVKPWLDEATQGMNFNWLTPEGWFSDAHAPGNFIWNVPLAAAEVVVEQCSSGRRKEISCPGPSLASLVCPSQTVLTCGQVVG
jgi:hypothetical protein